MSGPNVAIGLMGPLGRELAALIKERVAAEIAITQGSQGVRLIATDGDTADVVRSEDEEQVAGQVRGSTASTPVGQDTGGSPRSACYAFTVGRAVSVGAIQLQARDAGDGTPLPIGNFWVSIWSGSPKADTFVGTFGLRESVRVSYSAYIDIYLIAAAPFALVPGTQYWVCIGGGDPEEALPADGWADTDLHVLKLSEVGAGLMHKDSSVGGVHRPPYAGGDYLIDSDSALWFRLFEYRDVIKSVPIAPSSVLPSTGEIAVMDRVGGLHVRRQIRGGMGGQTSIRGLGAGSRSGGGYGGGPGGPPGSIEHNDTSGKQGGEDGPPKYYFHLTDEEYGGEWAHLLRATEDGGDVPLQGVQNTDATNIWHSGLSLKHKTSGDMADGFAIGAMFQIEDAGGLFTLGRFGMVRAGADQHGDFIWQFYDGASYTERLRMAYSGIITHVADVAAGEWAFVSTTRDAATNLKHCSFVAKRKLSAGSPVVGFAGGYLFTFEDGAGTEEKVAALYAEYAGALDTADFTWVVHPLDAPDELMRLYHAGYLWTRRLALGNAASPGYRLHIVGSETGGAQRNFIYCQNPSASTGATCNIVIANDIGQTVQIGMQGSNYNGIPGWANLSVFAGSGAGTRIFAGGADIDFWHYPGSVRTESFRITQAAKLRHRLGSVCMLVTVHTPNTSEQFDFTSAFAAGVTPAVVVTPQSDYAVSCRVIGITNVHFTIKLGSSPGYDCNFAVHAFVPE